LAFPYYTSNGMISSHSIFVDPNDGGYRAPDSVDLMLISVHGATDATSFKYPFWDPNVYWVSSEAKLGNNGRGARMFASYSCATMNGDTSARVAKLFSGGLIVAMGGWDTVWNGCFWGQNVQSLMAVSNLDYAWLYGVYDAYSGNHPVTWATGQSPADCFARMQSSYNGVAVEPHYTSYNTYCLEWI
jgi:hypothetical protein